MVFIIFLSFRPKNKLASGPDRNLSFGPRHYLSAGPSRLSCGSQVKARGISKMKIYAMILTTDSSRLQNTKYISNVYFTEQNVFILKNLCTFSL